MNITMTSCRALLTNHAYSEEVRKLEGSADAEKRRNT